MWTPSYSIQCSTRRSALFKGAFHQTKALEEKEQVIISKWVLWHQTHLLNTYPPAIPKDTEKKDPVTTESLFPALSCPVPTPPPHPWWTPRLWACWEHTARATVPAHRCWLWWLAMCRQCHHPQGHDTNVIIRTLSPFWKLLWKEHWGTAWGCFPLLLADYSHLFPSSTKCANHENTSQWLACYNPPPNKPNGHQN